MKFLVMSLLILSPVMSFAGTVCAGETYKGAVVQVTVDTVGTMGSIQGGRVDIEDEDGKKSSYTLKREEIVQYFEGVEGKDLEKGLVFMSAYADYNFPIFIRYIGKNHEDGDLIDILKSKTRKKEPGNEMRVWKGPGFQGGGQYQFTDVVCSVSTDV